ncbi:MAG: hypothetical protein NXH82_13195 [Rhodobacteraceae bacterium]|nr:hypothetical protein [Paracoccaceae bacterium]
MAPFSRIAGGGGIEAMALVKLGLKVMVVALVLGHATIGAGPAGAQPDGDLRRVVLDDPDGRLNLRAAPSASAPILGRLPDSQQVLSQACRVAEGRRWCEVVPLTAPGVAGGARGWVAEAFLSEPSSLQPAPAPPSGDASAPPDTSAAPVAVGAATRDDPDFQTSGQLPCAPDGAAPLTPCDFGLRATEADLLKLTVFWPDQGSRTIHFRQGRPVAFERSAAETGLSLIFARELGRIDIAIGAERYAVPSVLLRDPGVASE